MFALAPFRNSLVALALLVAPFVSASPALSQDAEVTAQGTKLTTNQQLQRMRRSLARIRRAVDSNTANYTSVSNNISDVKNSLGSLNQRVITGNTTAPTTPQNVIGSNKSSTNYLSFDIYPTVRGEAVVQHKNTGVMLWVRTLEGSKTVSEYKLEFSFEGRTADQKTADAMMLNACLSHFNRVSDAPNGGTFYIYPSTDEKIGLACSSTVNR